VFNDVNANGVIDAGETGFSGATVFLDTNNNGILDTGPTKTYTSTNVPLAISASGTPTVTSTLSVADTATVADVNVKLNITHSWDADLVVSLKSPSGTSVTLFSKIGSSGDNFTNTILDDQAATSIAAGSAPFSGTFKPSPGALSSFTGAALNGTWTLTVQDTATQDGGTLNSWSIDITTGGESLTTTDASGNYSFTGLAAGSYNVAHVVPVGYAQSFPGGDGRHHVTLAAADTFTGNFGDRLPPATITGLVFNDTNGNGKQDSGEPPLSGISVYLDLDNSGSLTAGDTTVTTDASGIYTFNNLATYQGYYKNYIVAEVLPGGFTHVAPLRPSLQPSTNVNTSKMSGEQSETAIDIDPVNPNRVFVASNQIGTSGMFGAYSTDGGATWTPRTFANGSDGVPTSIGDPTHAFDRFGNLWEANLTSSGTHTEVLRSTNGGQTFTAFQDLAASTDQPTVVTGPSSTAGRDLVVVVFNQASGQWASFLEVNASGPIGTFSAPVLLPSSNSGLSGEYSDASVGPNGEVAVAYQHSSGQGPDTIYFNLDPDGIGGAPFGSRIAVTSTNVGGFDFITPQPNRSVDAEIDLSWDVSNGPNHGRLYMLYTEEVVNENNDTEIMLRYSDNKGTTWSSPVRINDDTGTNAQFLPRMSLDPTTGYLAFSWYDARNDPGNFQSEFWATASFDGGKTFMPNIKLSSGKSTPLGGNDYGDYTGLSYVNGRFISVWTDNSNSTGNNPGGTASHDIYVAKVTVVPNSTPNYVVSAYSGQVYSGLDFAIQGFIAPAPTVTIDQKIGQVDPTNSSTIDFTVVFSTPVSDFATGDVTLSGTAGATTAIVTGSGTTYNVAVTGMTSSGTVIATIAAGVATSGGSGNLASTSTDNTVTFDTSLPTASSTPAGVSTFGDTSYLFTVTYSDNLAVSGSTFDGNDVRVTGPGLFDVPAALVTVDSPGDGSPRTVTYSITPPGGSWNNADNGTYFVSLQGSQITDTAGNAAIAGTLGTFDVIVPAPVTVTGIQINDGSAQRSLVTSLTVTFSGPVSLPAIPADAFQLVRQSPGGSVALNAVVNGNAVTLNFIGGTVNGISLADGLYTLTVSKSQVNGGNFDSTGTNLPGDDFVYVGNTITQKLFRLFGDADGNAAVTSNDFAVFRTFFGLSGPSMFDFDGNNQTNSDDFAQFRQRFGLSLTP